MNDLPTALTRPPLAARHPVPPAQRPALPPVLRSAATSLALLLGLPLAASAQTVTGTVVEYVNTADFPRSVGGQYFYSADPAEQAFVDSGGAGRFQRTGLQFSAGGSTEVCRFYGSVKPGPNSHFFTADSGECAYLRSLQRTPTPADIPQWNYEGTGFRVAAAVSGTCPTGTQPVHRAYNNGFTRGFDSNHRFATNRATLDALVANSGWTYEGIVFCALTTAPPVSPYPPGLSDQTITVAGVARQYRVHVPATLTGAPTALVFVLHGGGGTGLDVAITGAHPLSVFRTVADREGFVVVYPGGMPDSLGQAGWADCRNDDNATSGADDVGFLTALVDQVRGQYGLPTTRVFMTGGSNGAMMTHAFAISRPDRVAAVATGSGSLAANPKPGPCTAGPTTPVPIMILHGTADTQMPYEGGCVANVGGACNRGRVISAVATRDRWLQANGLTGVVPTQQVVEIDRNDGGPANRFDYAGNPPLRWWRLDGAGHTVPSRTVLVQPNPQTGIQSRDVEFAEIVWDFFKSRLTAPPPGAAALQQARDYNFAMGGQTYIVMHQGQTLAEAYANGGAADRVQLLASATKGFTGMLGAIAASEGLFDLDEPVARRALVEWQNDAQKSKITFRHLLTMTSGLVELNDLAGWLDYLRAPVANPAGTVFVYSGDPNIFGLALERLLGGESVVDYFNRKLFQPLGITSMRWGSNFLDGHPQLSGGAYVTARDWSRFGEFIRRTMDGTWTGPPLLSRTLFDQVFTGNPAHPAYGFFWWLKRPVPTELAAIIDANNKNQYTREIKPIVDDPLVPADFVMAAGAYDQRLYVIPSRGLTIVRNGPTGRNDFVDTEFLDRLLGPAAP